MFSLSLSLIESLIQSPIDSCCGLKLSGAVERLSSGLGSRSSSRNPIKLSSGLSTEPSGPLAFHSRKLDHKRDRSQFPSRKHDRKRRRFRSGNSAPWGYSPIKGNDQAYDHAYDYAWGTTKLTITLTTTLLSTFSGEAHFGHLAVS